MTSLAGLRALVIGGGSGIGRAVADGAGDAGAQVGIIDLRVDDAPAGVTTSQVADATDAEALDAAIGRVAEDLGGIDALVHTAGMHDGFATIMELDPDDLAAAARRLLDVNLVSAMLSVRCAVPHLEASLAPSVTLTSSESGFGGRGGGPLYCASKWGIRGLVASLSTQLAPWLRVNGVAPGGVTGTGLRGIGDEDVVGARPGRDEAIRDGTKLDVLIRPEDVAGAYLYLMSPTAAGTVTGTVVNVDGGRNTI